MDNKMLGESGTEITNPIGIAAPTLDKNLSTGVDKVGDKPTEDYSCGLYKDRMTIYPGRMYISANDIVFHPQIFNSTMVTILASDIIGIFKRNTAYVFPNAIEIVTKQRQKYFFTSFLYRDAAFAALQGLVTRSERSVASHDEDEIIVFSDEEKHSDEDVDHVQKDDLEPVSPLKNLDNFTNNVMRHMGISKLSAGEGGTEVVPKRSSPLPTQLAANESIEAHKTAVRATVDSPPPTKAAAKKPRGLELDAKSKSESHIMPLAPVGLVPPSSASPVISRDVPPKEVKETKPSKEVKETKESIEKTKANQAELRAKEIKEEVATLVHTPPVPRLQAALPVSEQCEHMTWAFDDQLKPWVIESYPISVLDFYSLIVGSSFWTEVNEESGYTEMTVTPWLMRQGATGTCCQYRQMNFRMAIAFKIGPKSTRVQQVQRCKLRNPNELAIETSSYSKDVPYGDNFSVDSLIVVSTNEQGGCTLKLASRVNFTKTIWAVGAVIEKGALQGNKEFFTLWCAKVRTKIHHHHALPTTPTSTSTTSEPLVLPQTSEPTVIHSPMHSPVLVHHSPSVTSPEVVIPAARTEPPLIDPLYISIALAIILFLVVFPYVFFLHSRINSLEARLTTSTYKMEQQMSYLHMYTQKLHNLTDVELKQNLQDVQPFEMNSATIHQWKQRISTVSRKLTESMFAVDLLGSEVDSVLLNKFQENEAWSPAFWIVASITLSVVGASIYFYPGLLKKSR